MSKNQRQAILIIIIIIFLSVLFSPRIDRTSNSSTNNFGMDARLFLHRIQNKIEGVFDKEEKKYISNSFVEDESAVIDVVDRVSPSVVSIVVSTDTIDPFSDSEIIDEGIGTGFIVDPTGIIVTNSHVVDDPAGNYSVVLSDGSTYEVAEVHMDEVTDIAVLEINARDLRTVELGDSDNLKVGQRAIAIGNALGRFSNTVTVGVVSGISRELTAYGREGDLKTYEGAIQTDAALNPGNSGGPLLNSSGQVIGINVATSQYADNVGFAIPVNTLKPILDSFFEEGRIVKPFLGVSYQIITEELAKIRDYPEGAFISRVLENSSAQNAGIIRGDIIIEIEGEKINSRNSLSKVIGKYKVGDFIEIKVDREGKVINLGATLQEAPDTDSIE